ncbi:MAG: hypothetical protein EOO33_10690 [Comamonadaceae bacterium]|nr:MAG: hypothetical protein EOO33_10690 [Comamonadaceae bacterium]
MNYPLRRAAPCGRQRRQPFGHVQACAGRLGAAALSPFSGLAARIGKGDDAGGLAKPVPRRLLALGRAGFER